MQIDQCLLNVDGSILPRKPQASIKTNKQKRKNNSKMSVGPPSVYCMKQCVKALSSPRSTHFMKPVSDRPREEDTTNRELAPQENWCNPGTVSSTRQKEGVAVGNVADHHCCVFQFRLFWMGIFAIILSLLHLFILKFRIVFEFVALQTLRGHVQNW